MSAQALQLVDTPSRPFNCKSIYTKTVLRDMSFMVDILIHDLSEEESAYGPICGLHPSVRPKFGCEIRCGDCCLRANGEVKETVDLCSYMGAVRLSGSCGAPIS
jgi:hypothetical protein